MNRKNKYHRFFLGLATLLSAVFLVAPPFEKNPQQCEIAQTIGKEKKNNPLRKKFK